MIYTISLDLFVDSDEIFTENQISDFLKAAISGSAIDVKNIKLIEVND